VQKTGSLLFKKRRGQAATSLFYNNDPGFCTLFFAPHILDLIFLKFQTLKKISGRLDKLDNRVQIDWSTASNKEEKREQEKSAISSKILQTFMNTIYILERPHLNS
jgi:hypothetical protein